MAANALAQEGASQRGQGMGAAGSHRLDGFVQVDYVNSALSEDQLEDGSGTPLNRDRFLVRRARLELAGDSGADDPWPWLEYVVEADANTLDGLQVGMRQVEGAVRWVLPAELDVALPLDLRVGAGLFHAPFGYEVYEQRDVERLFTERSLMGQAFFPGQLDVGVRVTARLDWSDTGDDTSIRLDVALQNGEPIGTSAFPSRDPNSAKDLVARVAFGTALTDGARLQAGISGTSGTGFHPGTTPTKEMLVWRDRNEDGIVQSTELTAIAGSAGSPSENFDRQGLAADLQVFVDVPRLGELGVFLAGALANNLDRAVRPADPVLLGRDQRQLGMYAAVTQALGEHLLVGFRFDYYRPEIDRTELQGGELVRSGERFLTYTTAVGGVLPLGSMQGRLIAEYAIQRDPLGRDERGLPADLRNDELTIRGQVRF